MERPDNAHLRVADADREHVAALLQRAVGRGELTIDEFTDRIGAALAVETRGELEAVVGDLPDAELLPLDAVETAYPAATPGSNSAVVGTWTVPATLRVHRVLGDTFVDFSHATIPRVGVRIELRVGLGNVVIVVPPTCDVDVRRVRAGLGRFRRAVPQPVTAPDHHLLVVGRIRIGALHLLPTGCWQARRLQRGARFEPASRRGLSPTVPPHG